MMSSMHRPAMAVQAAGNGGSCCNLSSGKTEPTTQLQLPNVSSTAMNPLRTTASMAPAIALLLHADFRDLTPLNPSCSPQAVLCTFLI
jgi:hypothetical protein